MIAARGLALAVTHENSIPLSADARGLEWLGRGEVAGLPVPVLMLLVVLALFRLGRDFAGSDVVGVAFPDNLFLGDEPALAQLFRLHRPTGKNVVAIVELTAANRDRYGPTAIYPGRLNGDEFVIESIPDKGPRDTTFELKGALSAFTGVGRYIFLPEVFAAIDEVDATLPSGKELDDIPVMQLLLRSGRLTGCRIRGDFLDVGLPPGYREADERLGRRKP